MSWIIKAKKRKSREVVILSYVFDDLIFANVAFSALKAGLVSKFIKRNFIHLRIENK